MQRIDMFKWLTEVLQYLGGTPHQVVTTERQQFKQMTISFEVPVRQDLGTIIPIVASGKESPVQMTYERSAIEACLLGLEIYVYLIPDLLEFKIKALRQNQHDIVSLCESLSRENLHAIKKFYVKPWSSWVIIRLRGEQHIQGKVCTRLLLNFDLRHLLPQNQCSPSTPKHFLVEVKQRIAHLSVH
ncbi:hypothetical protein PVAP13_3NG269700 [Panicum virgatum]|uniref:Uncharacterized protein n=1 Tax=Panicum virgatum TaxID=38727 RepID=A0A8T0UJS3_PANVG|nr:hypothetical protein PVAP13_3NG269700 [Panicum virgatum]